MKSSKDLQVNNASKIPLIGGFFDNSEQLSGGVIDQLAQLEQGMGVNFNDVSYRDPTTIKLNADLLRQQRDALRRLAYLSEEGFSPEHRAAFEAAQNEAALMAQRNRQGVLENAMQRGAMGSGATLALQQQAEQNAANQARASQLDQAAKAAQRRALMTQAYGNMLSSNQDQDIKVNAANQSVLNRFNELNTDLDWRKRAQQYNQQQDRFNRQSDISDRYINNIYGQSIANKGDRQGIEELIKGGVKAIAGAS
jgi:hypothetical protein